ncbi:hypothetical protein ACFL5H_00150 [Candidatus Latescibacterota bacterium]
MMEKARLKRLVAKKELDLQILLKALTFELLTAELFNVSPFGITNQKS